VKAGGTKLEHFKISNTMKNKMLVGEVANPSGPGAAQFKIVGGLSHFSLSRGRSGDKIMVQYTPSAPGAADTATIAITSSDPTQHSFTVGLTGKGKK
jgi:hypothetical protein